MEGHRQPFSAKAGAAENGARDIDCTVCGGRSKVLPGQALRCALCGAAGAKKLRDRFESRLFRDGAGRPLRLRDLYGAGQELRLWCTHCRTPHEIRFATPREVEALLGAINPTVAEACQHLTCAAAGKHGMVGIAAAPRRAAQMNLFA